MKEHGGEVLEYPGSFAVKANYAWRNLPSHARWTFIVGDDVKFHEEWLRRAQAKARAEGLMVCATNTSRILGSCRVNTVHTC